MNLQLGNPSRLAELSINNKRTPAMPLSPEAQTRIARESRVLWENFIEFHDGKYDYASLFETGPTFSPKAVNETLLDFFEFCSQMLLGDVYETEIWWQDLSDLRDEADKNRATSWLAYEKMASDRIRLTIYLDHECLLDRVPASRLQTIRCKLILHETGHLFHTDYLFQYTARYPFVREATPVHEAEAWWFCYALLGLGIAQCACEKKANPRTSELPPIWELIQMPSAEKE